GNRFAFLLRGRSSKSAIILTLGK
ncbi:hypothetical protein D046_0931B, partial [Vibrio parahaemolyticus V-223/04]